MATIAGGVLASYVGFLGGDDPVKQQEFATHLLTASNHVGSWRPFWLPKCSFPKPARASTVTSRCPVNRLAIMCWDAISRGTGDGLKLAINVGAMLIVFTALMAMLNAMISGSFGEWIGWNAHTGGFYLFGSNNIPAESYELWNEQLGCYVIHYEGSNPLIPHTFQPDYITLNMYIQEVTSSRFTGFNLEYILGDTPLSHCLDIRYAF